MRTLPVTHGSGRRCQIDDRGGGVDRPDAADRQAGEDIFEIGGVVKAFRGPGV